MSILLMREASHTHNNVVPPKMDLLLGGIAWVGVGYAARMGEDAHATTEGFFAGLELKSLYKGGSS